MENKTIASISISGEITLNLHSLNNEGGEGNQIITRQVTVIDKNSTEHTVNAISGDMFKHIHVGHLINYAASKNLPLCSNCKIFDPNRLSSGEDLGKALTGNYEDKQVVDQLIEQCIIDDTHGVLVTKIGNKNKNVPRKSVIEFGWTVGLPEKNNTETYVHTKLVSDSASKKSDDAGNVGQNIFHRPANYGIYALVCSIDAYRISFNDITRKYVRNINRKDRYQALLISLLHTFINPKGAMTSTQKPHITDFKGIVAVSYKLVPAPTISPLNDNYKCEIVTIAQNLNRIEPDSIEIKPFDGLGVLSGIISDLMQYEPYQIQ